MRYTLKIKISIPISDVADLLAVINTTQFKYDNGLLYLTFYGTLYACIDIANTLQNYPYDDNLTILSVSMVKGDK